jgi:hypothetical protein
MRTVQLRWCLLVSLTIHLLLLWRLGLVLIRQPTSFPPFNVRTLELPPEKATEQDETSSGLLSRSRASKASSTPASVASRATPDAPPAQTQDISKPFMPESSGERDSRPDLSETSVSPGTVGAGIGAGIETSEGGISVGGGGRAEAGTAPSVSEGKSTGAGASSAGRGGRTGTGGWSPPRDFRPATPAAPVQIPEALRYRARPYPESQIYHEIDRYVLFGPDLRSAVSVPGTEICLESDLLRTRETFVFNQTITDISKCQREPDGDSFRLNCPSSAHRKVATENYLSSTVHYTVNRCLLYDKSHCYLEEPGDSGRKACNPINRYEGIWHSDTVFDFKCTKSQAQNYSHPLQYNIRFFRDLTIGYNVPKYKKLLVTETRSIAPCH